MFFNYPDEYNVQVSYSDNSSLEHYTHLDN